MAMLQADNGNYSPGIVPLMPCHLHVSRGILHAQSLSVVGTSQEIPNVSHSHVVTDTTLARTKERKSLSCSPMIFPKPSPCFQKSHVPNSVSECARGGCWTAGGSGKAWNIPQHRTLV